MQGNPYYVHPGGDYTQGLAGLANTFNQMGQRRRQEEQQAKKEEAAQKAIDKFVKMKTEAVEAYRSNDPDVVAEFILQNPEMTQAFDKAMTHKSDVTKQNYKDSLFNLYLHPETLEEVHSTRKATLKSEGVSTEQQKDTDAFYQKYKDASPEEVQKGAAMLIASRFPDEWTKYRRAIGGGVEGTTDEKNFSNYLKLKESNPEQAKLFGRQIGLFKNSAEAKDTRTTAIKEFEYGLEHPEFRLAQEAKEDKKKTEDTQSKTFDTTTKLRKEFLSQSAPYQKVRDSYTRVVGSTEDPSAAGDLSLIFNYMKMLDPGSVVRESEFATAAASGSWGDRLKAAGQKIMAGERLSDEMRADFTSKAKVLMQGMENQHKQRVSNYKHIADKNKLPADEVVIDITVPSKSTLVDKPSKDKTDDELRKSLGL